jgi:protein SCO1
MSKMNKQARDAAGKGVLIFIVIVGALAAGAMSWFLLNPKQTAVTQVVTKQATLLPELRTLPPFSLLDQKGNRFDNQRLLGKWTLLDFGYTHCPDICPTNLAMLAQVSQLLNQSASKPAHQIAFVSIDPARDTPELLAEYVAYFDTDFLGITGSDEALRSLTRPLGVLYEKVETKESAMGYVMDHSASIMLLDPKGRYRALFSPPHDATIMAQDILAIIQAE